MGDMLASRVRAPRGVAPQEVLQKKCETVLFRRHLVTAIGRWTLVTSSYWGPRVDARRLPPPSTLRTRR